MTKKLSDNSLEEAPAIPIGGARPVRLRRSLKPKANTQSRKKHRKPASAPGGIHQRANKRISW
jgi:hypothetical protein